MKIVGLTGGIGSGKTTVAQYFKNLGVPLFIADVEAKRLMNTSKVIKRKLESLFGEEAYINKSLNRVYIAEQVFGNPRKLSSLNDVVHPKVHQCFKKWVSKQKASYVIYEAAIIFELGRETEFDYTILVVADKEERIKRVLARDKTTKEHIEKRMDSQWTDDRKIPLADYIIRNTTLKEIEKQVDQTHKKLRQL